MSVIQSLIQRPVKQFPERLLRRVLRESSVLQGLSGQLPQGFDNGIHLDFKNNFHYIKVPGGDPVIAPLTSLFTFTGGNQSLYRGAAGLLVQSVTNTPRIEYDASGNLLGLLIEGARTNIWLQSQTLGTTWTLNAATVSATNVVAPDGTATGDTLLADAGAGTIPRFANTSTATTAAAYTASFWAKAGTYTFVQVYVNSQAAEWANFTLSGAGTATMNGTGTARIEAWANGWYRCSMTYTAGDIDRRPFVMLAASASATRAQTWSPAGTESVSFWGMQFELGSFPSSYIPTTTVGVARMDDQAQRSAGSEISSSVGTIFAEFDAPVFTGFDGRCFVLDDGSGNNRFCLRASNANLNAFTTGGGVGDGSAQIVSVLVANVMSRGAAAMAANDLSVSHNGSAITQDAALTLPTGINRFNLGFDPSGAAGTRLFGHIRRLDYWPERKPNSELQRLTT